MGAIAWERSGAERRSRWAARATLPWRKFAGLLQVRRVCRNWFEVAAFLGRARRVVDIELRSGVVVRVTGRSQFPAVLEGEAWGLAALAVACGPLAAGDGWLSFRYRGRQLRFFAGPVRDYSMVLREQFADELYRWLDVEGRDVLDVGGSIGDSAIYFALNGARRVLALEPYPASFRVMQANVAANRLESVITPVCAGAGRDGSIEVSTEVASISATLRASATGVTVPTCSLATLLAQAHWSDPVAKIDCEGGEYPLLMDASDRDLRRFRRYFIEYHHGPHDLARRLRNAGFEVWYTGGRPEVDRLSGEVRELGLMRARRRGLI